MPGHNSVGGVDRTTQFITSTPESDAQGGGTAASGRTVNRAEPEQHVGRSERPVLSPKPTTLGQRQVGPQSSSAQLSPTGPTPQTQELDLGDGKGKIIFTRTNGEDLPLASDRLMGEVHAKEKSGELDPGSASKLGKLLGAVKGGIQFLMHSREAQVGIGLVGIGACIIGGAFCPVLLIGAGPFILIFANGFIDNPMLAGPEQGQQPPGNNTPDKKTDKSEERNDTGDKKPETQPGKKAPADGSLENASVAQKDESSEAVLKAKQKHDQDDQLRKKQDEQKERELAAQKEQAEQLKTKVATQLQDQGINTTALVVPQDELESTLNGITDTTAQAQVIGDQPFELDKYLTGEGSPLNGRLGISEEQREGLANAIRIHIAYVLPKTTEAPLGLTDSHQRAGDVRPEEWQQLHTAMVKHAVGDLVDYADQHGGKLPGSMQGKKSARLSRPYLVARAMHHVGLDRLDDQDSPIGGYVKDANARKGLQSWVGTMQRELVAEARDKGKTKTFADLLKSA